MPATKPDILKPKNVKKKLRLMAELFDFAYQVKKHQLKKKFPDLSDRELNYKTYALIEKGCAD